jgi:hypothetical protein
MDFDGLNNYISALVNHPQWKPNNRVVTDYRKIDTSAFEDEYITSKAKIYAGILKDQAKKIGTTINASIIIKGVQEKSHNLMNDIIQLFKVKIINKAFYNEEEAVEWLLSFKSI